MSAAKNERQEEQAVTGSTSSRAWRYLKIAVPVAVGLGAIAACVLFPPAALFLAPAVEFLALSVIPATVGVYAGLIAFGTITTSLAIAAALATRLLMSATAAVFNAIAQCCASDKDVDEDEANSTDPDEESGLHGSDTIPAQRNADRGCCHRNPVRSRVVIEELADDQELNTNKPA